MSKSLIYLDHAAATPVDPAVLAEMEPYFAQKFFNPAASYGAAKSIKRDLDAAKSRIGEVLGVKSTELILTSGGTEANNLAIKGVMAQFPGKKVLASAIEHESVLEPLKSYKHKLLPVDKFGALDIKKSLQLVDEDTVLVSVMLANNEVGSIQLISEFSRELDKIRKSRKNKLPLYLHTDAAQAPLYLDIHPHRLGADLMSLNGGKIYGPKQTGVLYVRAGLSIEPQILGGGQQRGMRSGTESAAAAIGLASALEIAQAKKPVELKRLSELQDYFFDQLQAKIPGAIINGPRKKRLPNNLHITIPGMDNERAIFELDEAGILAAAGSACAAEAGEPSHVLRAMGLSDELARASLRLTMGRSTTKTDLDKTLKALASLAP